MRLRRLIPLERPRREHPMRQHAAVDHVAILIRTDEPQLVQRGLALGDRHRGARRVGRLLAER